MLSQMAKADLAALRSAGYAPTDDEIVKLNDLAIRIERGKDLTPANMPRIAFAGNVVLHEPTIGSMQWWLDYGRDSAWNDPGRLMTYFFMLAHAKDVNMLSQLQKPRDVRKAVRTWIKGCSATENELWRALMWVKCGSEDAARMTEKNCFECSLDYEQQADALWMTLIAASGATGLSPDDLKTRTQSELNGMLVQANLHARIPMKASVARDYIAYRHVLKQIEDRGLNG